MSRFATLLAVSAALLSCTTTRRAEMDTSPLPAAAPLDEVATVPSATSRGDFRLVPNTTLEGMVVDEAGRPLRGVKVFTRSRQTASPPTECRATTDVKGRFRCENLAPGGYGLSFVDERRSRVEEWVEIPRSQPLAVTLARGVLISGRVIDDRGRPVAGAVVRLEADVFGASKPPAIGPRSGWSCSPSSFERPILAGVRADEQGGFSFRPQHPGRFVLLAEWGAGEYAQRRFEAGPGPIEVKLAPEPGELIAGRVELRSDKGWHGPARVEVRAFARGAVGPVGEALSLEDGRFALRVPAPGEYTLVVRGRRYFHEAPLAVRSGETDAVIRLVPGVWVSGRVLLPDGLPAPSYSVNGEPLHSPDGRFELPVRAEKRLELRVEAPGCAPLQYRLATMTPDVELPDLRLAPDSQARLRPNESDLSRELGELEQFGEVPACRSLGSVEQSAPRGRSIELSPAQRDRLRRVLPYLGSPWEPVVKRAVAVLCNIGGAEARQAILALSRRYPCRWWLSELIGPTGGGRVERCGQPVESAGQEYRRADAETIAGWSSDATRGRARRISDGDDAEFLAALRDQAAIDIPRRRAAVAVLAEIDSERALLLLYRDAVNGFESASRPHPNNWSPGSAVELKAFVDGVGGAALRATATRSGVPRAEVLARMSERLSNSEGQLLSLSVQQDETLLAELRQWGQTADLSKFQGPGACLFLRSARAPPAGRR